MLRWSFWLTSVVSGISLCSPVIYCWLTWQLESGERNDSGTFVFPLLRGLHFWEGVIIHWSGKGFNCSGELCWCFFLSYSRPSIEDFCVCVFECFVCSGRRVMSRLVWDWQASWTGRDGKKKKKRERERKKQRPLECLFCQAWAHALSVCIQRWICPARGRDWNGRSLQEDERQRGLSLPPLQLPLSAQPRQLQPSPAAAATATTTHVVPQQQQQQQYQIVPVVVQSQAAHRRRRGRPFHPADSGSRVARAGRLRLVPGDHPVTQPERREAEASHQASHERLHGVGPGRPA